MQRRLISLGVFSLSVVLWLIVWNGAVGLESLRHDALLWLGFVVFSVLSVAQVISDIVGDPHCEVNWDEKAATDALLSVTASILLAISLLVSLSNVNEGPPILRHTPFYSATLTTFLWIVVGVFTLTWLEAMKRNDGDGLGVLLRSAKRAAFFQAVGWASVAIVSLFYMLQRQRAL